MHRLLSSLFKLLRLLFRLLRFCSPVIEAMLQIALTGDVLVLCRVATTLLLLFNCVTGEFVDVGVVLPFIVWLLLMWLPFSPFMDDRFVNGVLLVLPGVVRSWLKPLLWLFVKLFVNRLPPKLVLLVVFRPEPFDKPKFDSTLSKHDVLFEVAGLLQLAAATAFNSSPLSSELAFEFWWLACCWCAWLARCADCWCRKCRLFCRLLCRLFCMLLCAAAAERLNWFNWFNWWPVNELKPGGVIEFKLFSSWCRFWLR